MRETEERANEIEQGEDTGIWSTEKKQASPISRFTHLCGKSTMKRTLQDVFQA